MHYLSIFLTRMFLLGIFYTLLAGSVFSAFAQAPKAEAPMVLVHGSNNVQVTSADIASELRRIPEASREDLLAKPDMVKQMASNLLLRRILSAQAEATQMDKDTVLAATLAVARERILSNARLTQLDTRNTPNDAELDTYARNIYQSNPAKYDKPAQTRARHILIPKSDPESFKKAKDLLTQLRAGASFEELAKLHSTDSGSAAKGGDLGFFPAGKMVGPFDRALEKLIKPGDLSEPVETQFGYHIIRLEERQERTSRLYSEVQSQVKAEALVAILKEARLQLAAELNKDFIFDDAAIGAMGKAAAK